MTVDPDRNSVPDSDDETPETTDGVYSTDSSTATPTPSARKFSPTVASRATGRRKEAVAQVRLVPGTGHWVVNGRELSVYFPNRVHQQIVNEPFATLELMGSYDVIAKVNGGGISGQAGAIRLGVARSLNSADTENNRPALKKAGLLTRDPRAVERKKAGLKKARKAPQYSKR